MHSRGQHKVELHVYVRHVLCVRVHAHHHNNVYLFVSAFFICLLGKLST